MPSRLLAAFLACVLLWTAFAGQEHIASRIAGTPIEWTDPRATLADGSVGDHHLDDQPAQSLGELQPDLPALAAAEDRTMSALAQRSPPTWHPPVAWRSAWLDAPLRPPRSLSVTAC